MKTREQSKRLLLLGIAGCLLYVIGDFLFAATGRGQTTETIGFMVRVAYLDMGTWRMVVSILCGFVGTLLYYMGFHRMFGLLKLRVGDRIRIKLEPWEKREAEFGTWNRSEFDDDELLLCEPFFGEIVSAQ